MRPTEGAIWRLGWETKRGRRRGSKNCTSFVLPALPSLWLISQESWSSSFLFCLQSNGIIRITSRFDQVKLQLRITETEPLPHFHFKFNRTSCVCLLSTCTQPLWERNQRYTCVLLICRIKRESLSTLHSVAPAFTHMRAHGHRHQHSIRPLAFYPALLWCLCNRIRLTSLSHWMENVTTIDLHSTDSPDLHTMLLLKLNVSTHNVNECVCVRSRLWEGESLRKTDFFSFLQAQQLYGAFCQHKRMEQKCVSKTVCPGFPWLSVASRDALFIFLSWATLTSFVEGVCTQPQLLPVDYVKYAEDVWETDIFCLILEMKPV